MAPRRAKEPEDSSRRRRRPATTPEASENEMIALSVDLAKKQLREGTASAQVISHYLKLGSSRERLEQEQLARKNALLEVQKDAIASAQRVEDLYAKALDAMRSYAGQPIVEETFDD